MFVSKKFEFLFSNIVDAMPNVIFYGIILTYCITASLNVYFLPIPYYLSVPASIMLQFGRFAIVFINFLNPTGKVSRVPEYVALGAMIVAIFELLFSLEQDFSGAEYWSMFLFIGTIIAFGYFLEINFIKKGIDAYGLNKVKLKRKRKPKEDKPNISFSKTIS
jgi:hypothetical protein